MIYGLDNALVDILLQVSDEELTKFGLEKGVINFPNEEVLAQLKEMSAEKISPGGCAANTLSLLAKLGASTCMIGKIGKDFHGETFETQLKDDGVASSLVHADGGTGTATTLITPDAQRTFALHLGIANELTPEDIPSLDKGILYVSNFYLSDPKCGVAAQEAIKKMKSVGGKIALDLSDPTVVKPHVDALLQIIEEDVDIVFANEVEAEALTGKEAKEACHELAELCEIAVVKIGEKGSLIRSDGEVVHIPAHVVTAVDTTGAGDAYASGFLYGYTQGWSLKKSGDLGSILAAKVIQQVGARLDALPDDATNFS